jgi:hypothetical protein
MAQDIFKFTSPDLINLGKWYKRAPKEFVRAATNVINTTAFKSRLASIKIIEKNTHTRNKSFVKRSMRVDKAKHGRPLNAIVAEMGSIDISRQGRSTGFQELETGKRTKKKRVPTLASRGGNESRQVAGPVRMDKLGKMFRHRMVRGKGLKTKRAKVAAMLRMVKSGAIGRQPFIMPRGVKTGPMANMPAGVWRLGNKKKLELVNPFQDRNAKRTKRIKWMTKAVDEVASQRNLMKIWKKEVDFILKRRK